MSNYLRMQNPKTGSVQDIPAACVNDHKARGWVECSVPDRRAELSGSVIGRHAGRSALVIASGPSASSVPVERLRAWADREKLVTWATNDVFRMCGGKPFPRADYLLILDDNFWYAHAAALHGYLRENPSCLPVLHFDPGDEAVTYQRIAISMDETPDKRPAYQPGAYFHGNSSGIAAVQMAMHTGCKTVYLLGHDCKVIGGKTHGAGVRSGEELNNNYKQGSGMIPGYRLLAEHGRAQGVTILNLSSESAVDCFPRITFDDIERRKSRRAKV